MSWIALTLAAFSSSPCSTKAFNVVLSLVAHVGFANSFFPAKGFVSVPFARRRRGGCGQCGNAETAAAAQRMSNVVGSILIILSWKFPGTLETEGETELLRNNTWVALDVAHDILIS